MSKEIVLKTESLCIGYTRNKKNIVVKSNISLDFEAGKLIALVGKNGIGKSTFLKTITNIIRPLEGTIFVRSKPLQSYDALDLAKEMSLVLTDALPPSNLTVYELVALGRQPYTNWLGQLSENDKIKIKDAIELTEIEDLLEKNHTQISDGQLQKVLIARALAQDTAIIILDEPTTHLDLVHKVAILKLLQKLAQTTNKTILYSTHDLDLAIQLTDQMLVFTENEISLSTPCELIENGVFTNLYANDNIFFDNQTGQFKVK